MNDEIYTRDTGRSRNRVEPENTTKKKIGLAFIYSSLSANGIGRVITVTAKYLLKTGNIQQ